MALSKREERFCNEYVIDHNGRRAAEAAGWKETTAASAASRLLKREEIRGRIAELEKDAAEACGLTVIGVLRSLMETRNRCKQAEPVKVYDRALREYVETGEYVFDSQGANKADELLGKHLGMFEERKVVDANIGLSPDEKALLEKAVRRREGAEGMREA